MPRYDLPLSARSPYSPQSLAPPANDIPPFPSTRLAHPTHRLSSPEQLARDMACIQESFADVSLHPTHATKWKGKDEKGIAHWVADVRGNTPFRRQAAPSVSAPAPARHVLNSNSPTHPRNHHRAPSFAISPRVPAPPALSLQPSYEGTNSRSEFDYPEDFGDFDEEVLTAPSSVSARTSLSRKNVPSKVGISLHFILHFQVPLNLLFMVPSF